MRKIATIVYILFFFSDRFMALPGFKDPIIKLVNVYDEVGKFHVLYLEKYCKNQTVVDVFFL